MPTTSSKREAELEKYFGKIQASFTRKFLITFLDLVYLLALNLPLFVLAAYYDPDKGVIDAFHSLVKKDTKPQAIRCFGFSLWMFFCCYVYFVFIPSKTKYQTFFSNYLGMRAVSTNHTLSGQGKLLQRRLLKANFIPVLSLPLLSALFFGIAAITNNDDWHSQLLSKNKDWSDNKVLICVRLCTVAIFALQIHYLFTVAASKKALNWFTRSNGIIYVNYERAKLVMSTEDKPTPKKEEVVIVVDLPGVNTGINALALKALKKQDEVTEEEDDFDKLDFSEEIEATEEE